MADIVAELRISGPPGQDQVDYARIVQDFQRMVVEMNRRYLTPDGTMTVNWHMEDPVLTGLNFNISFNISVSPDDFVILLFDGTSGAAGITKFLPDTNAGAVITHITAVTGSGAPYLTPIIFSGTDASLFELTNGGVCPCDLIVNPPDDLPIGSYIENLTFTAPI